MIKFKLSKNIKNKFEKYLSSNLFNEQSPISKSSYWEHHSKKVKYFIKDDYIYLTGESGFYMPDKKYSIKTLWKLLKSQLKSIINFKNPYHLNFFVDNKIKKAFEKMVNDNKGNRPKFNQDKVVANKISDCKKIFPLKDYLINFHIIKTYYWLNVLSSYMDLSSTKFIAEIGGGNGNFISLLKHHCKTKCIVDIDLPETIIHCIAYIHFIFPNANILFPNEINKKINKEVLENYDFVFITPIQIELLDNNLIDLFINTGSFCEMNKKQIKEYFDLVQRSSRENSLFLNVNRAEKVPHAGEDNDNLKKPQVNRFTEYPFFQKNEILIFEICRFLGLLIKDPIYLRLERIKK